MKYFICEKLTDVQAKKQARVITRKSNCRFGMNQTEPINELFRFLSDPLLYRDLNGFLGIVLSQVLCR